MSEATMSREDEIKARLEKATKGPWIQLCLSVYGNDSKDHIANMHAREYVVPHQVFDDLNFIVNAREDVPYLLAENDRLRRENEELRKGKTPLCEKCKGFGVINKTEMHGKGPAQSLRVVQIPCPNGCEKSIALYACKEPTP